MEISVYAENIIRFRFSPENHFERDFSYAIAHDGPLPGPPPESQFKFKKVGDEFHVKTGALTCKISKTLHIAIYDKKGRLVSEDEKGFHWEPHGLFGGNIVFCSKKIQEQECFLGLGDKPNRLNLRGMRFENWGSDKYGFEKTSDPLYKNIPFYLGLHSGIGYGIFFDNSFRTRFDFGYERSDICSFWAKGGEMNYYFIYGPELTKVCEGFADLTGKPELPPLWALGYHQSKWSYFPEEKVKEIAKKFREEKIPCDAIHLDIDYMDGFRCFTWDEKRFPNPEALIAALESDGFKTVTIVNPGIKIDPDYEIYQQGVEARHFCRRADGPLLKGEVWPGLCHFPDFTNPKVRSWWSDLFEKFSESGVMHGIWNDMNEPSLTNDSTFPPDTRHDYEGSPCSHRKAHNVYGMQMARATWHGIKKAMFPRRPFALSRSGYAGIQRYAAVWTGDNLATWEHLWIANVQCQRLSISGISFCGSDIGGFIGDTHGELYTRWMQMAAFHPFFRTHASKDYSDQEPWSFGEPFTDAIRKAINLRYQLLPYMYTVFWRHVTYGTPVNLPLCFLDQENPDTYYRMEEFSLGRNLLICPVIQEGVEGRPIYLPDGEWYNFWNDDKETGKKEIWVETTLDTFPLFVRAGATIPFYPVAPFVHALKIECIELHVYFGEGPYTSELYEDSGEYYDYQQGNFMLRTFTVRGDNTSLNIFQLKKGRFNAEYNCFRFVVHGLPFIPVGIEVDGEIEMFDEMVNSAESIVAFEVEKNFESLSLKRLEGFAE